MHKLDSKSLDELIELFESGDGYPDEILTRIIALVRAVSETGKESAPIIDRIKALIEENLSTDLSLSEIADKLGISRFYMSHIFKKATAITIVEYRSELRLTKAKHLLVTTDSPITDIAYSCGFSGASYFTDRFVKSEGVTPSRYRVLNKR